MNLRLTRPVRDTTPTDQSATRLGQRRGPKALAAAGLLAAAVTGTVAAAPSASASAYSCHDGLNTATTAWGNCDGASNGWGGFNLIVNCYYYPQQHNYGYAGRGTTYVSCPSWSHVTAIFIQPAAY